MALKVVFFGTPLFAAHVLEYLVNNHVQIVAVVSKPDRPKGRSGQPVPTPVKSVALEKLPTVPLYQPELVSAPEFADTLKAFEADLFVVVAYGEIIKQHLLDMPILACINLHASLLPKYRGAAPIQQCIIEGEQESGITIMHMVRKMDAGDMIDTVKVAIGPDMTFGELEQALCESGQPALLQAILNFEKGRIQGTPQDISKVTFAPKIELEDCELKWEWSALDLHNLVRGTNPHPGAWCFINIKNEKKRLKIFRTKVIPLDHKALPGTILSFSKEGFIVAAGKNALQLIEIQLEGKKLIKADEFIRGFSKPDTLSFIISA